MDQSDSASGIFSNLLSFLKAVAPLVILIGGTALIGYGYGWLVEDFIASDIIYLYAVIPTIFTVIGLGRLSYSLGGKRIEKKAIQRALSNRPPKDGEVYAFIGVLEPDGEALTAPFSGKECIQSEYTLTEPVVEHGRREGTGVRREIRFSGFHLCPCHINTIQGPVAIHTYPPAVGFVSSWDENQPMKRSAGDFVEQTQFKDASGLNYVTQVGETVGRLFSNVEPPISMHVAFTGRRDIDNLGIHEEYVPPGLEVCLIAAYDAKQRAAVWHSRTSLTPLDMNFLKDRARGGLLRGILWGLLFLAIGLGIGILPLAPSRILDKLGSPGAGMLALRAERLGSAMDRDRLPLPWHLVTIMQPDARDEQGRTLLMYVPYHPELTRTLLERGADPNAVDDAGKTALQKAHTLEVARLLLEYGADASVLTGGYEARHLFKALGELDAQTVSLFLENGVSPEYFSAEGAYPLNLVVSRCDSDKNGGVREIVGMLLEKGSRTDVQDVTGMTALALAGDRCSREIVKMLSDSTNKVPD